MSESADPFRVFGVRPTLRADDAELERRFFALSRELHPDRASDQDRALVLDRSAAMNAAYRAIKDLPSRAKAWLEAHGTRLENVRGAAPSALALRGFEIQEAAEEARSGDPSASSRLAALAADVLSDRTAALARLAAAAETEPDVVGGPSDPFVARVAAVVSELNYLARQAAQIAALSEDS